MFLYKNIFQSLSSNPPFYLRNSFKFLKMSKSNPFLKRSIVDNAMKYLVLPNSHNYLIIQPSIESTLLHTQNWITTLGTKSQSLRNYLKATISSIRQSSPNTPSIIPIYSQGIGYIIKDIKIPIVIVEDHQKANAPFKITQRILP